MGGSMVMNNLEKMLINSCYIDFQNLVPPFF